MGFIFQDFDNVKMVSRLKGTLFLCAEQSNEQRMSNASALYTGGTYVLTCGLGILWETFVAPSPKGCVLGRN
jgi:hypothetical protein